MASPATLKDWITPRIGKNLTVCWNVNPTGPATGNVVDVGNDYVSVDIAGVTRVIPFSSLAWVTPAP
jgi:hypothetical protein